MVWVKKDEFKRRMKKLYKQRGSEKGYVNRSEFVLFSIKNKLPLFVNILGESESRYQIQYSRRPIFKVFFKIFLY